MSERIVRKAFFDFQKEERWLDEMAAEGWEMTRYTWCRYVFVKGEPGRYQYRIQLLPASVTAADSREYLRFLQEAGVEVVDTYQRWAFLRKEVDGTPFDLFSDRESRLAHHKRVATLFGALAAAQLPLVVVSAASVVSHIQDNAFFSLPLFIAQLALVGVLSAVAVRQFASVRRLERMAIVEE